MRKTLLIGLLGVWVGYHFAPVHVASPAAQTQATQYPDYDYVYVVTVCCGIDFTSDANAINIVEDIPDSITNEQLLDALYQIVDRHHVENPVLKYKGKEIARMWFKPILEQYVTVYEEGTGPRKHYLKTSIPAAVAAAMKPPGKGFFTVDSLATAWRTGQLPE